MPQDRAFEVGDHVVIRDWDDMAEEFGTQNDVRIKVGDGCTFVSGMKNICGREAVITRVYKNIYGHTRITLDIDTSWQITPGMLRHPDDARLQPVEIDRGQYIEFISGK